jgi:hypothetical protein
MNDQSISRPGGMLLLLSKITVKYLIKKRGKSVAPSKSWPNSPGEENLNLSGKEIRERASRDRL